MIRHSRWIPVIAALAACLTAAAARSAEVTSSPARREGLPVILVVDTEPVTTAQFEEALSRMHTGAVVEGRNAFDPKRLLFRVTNDVLIAREARRIEMDQEPEVSAPVNEYREQLAIQALRRTEILSRAAPSEEQLRGAFAQEYARATIRTLTCDSKDEAEQLRAELAAGADFAALARERSVDSLSARGGLIQSAVRRDLRPEIRDLVFQLSPGEVGGPVLTDAGWTLVRLEHLEPARDEDYDGAVAALRDRLRFENAERLEREFVEKIARAHALSIDEEAVEAIKPERLPGGLLMPRVPEGIDVVARIDGAPPVTAKEFARALQRRWSSIRSEEAAAASRRLVLDRLVRERLLTVEAASRHLGQSPEVEDRVRARENDLLVQRYLKEILSSSVSIDEGAMRARYEQEKGRFARPPKLHLVQITTADRAVAERVARLAREGSDPAWLARRYSTDRFAEKGGDRGWSVPQPAASEFDRRLAAAAQGDVIGPEGTEGEFRVLIVTAREEQGAYSFREVSGNVREMIFNEQFRAALHELVATLREQAQITVHEDQLELLQIAGQPSAEPDAGGQHAAFGH